MSFVEEKNFYRDHKMYRPDPDPDPTGSLVNWLTDPDP